MADPQMVEARKTHRRGKSELGFRKMLSRKENKAVLFDTLLTTAGVSSLATVYLLGIVAGLLSPELWVAGLIIGGGLVAGGVTKGLLDSSRFKNRKETQTAPA